MHKVAVITGGTSGIGLCTAKHLIQNGFIVYEISRRQSDNPRHISADVSDESSIASAISQVMETEGRIDTLICNVGFGISGAVEFTNTEDAKRLMDVNFFGAVNIIKAAMPFLRETRGRIICTSSVAAVLPIPFQTYYSVTKAAINAFVTALSNEISPFGVSVCSIMPGDIKTGFTGAREKNISGDDIYSGRIERSVSRMEKDEMSGMPPDRAGKFIAKIALKRRIKTSYAIGAQYKLFVLLSRILPSSVVVKILGIMYAK